MRKEDPWARIAALPPLDPRHEFFMNILHGPEGSQQAHDRLVDIVRWIDGKLQTLTLGISKTAPQRPDVTRHEFRTLRSEEVRTGGGNATVDEPLEVLLPAYPLKAAKVQRFFGGLRDRRSRIETVLVPPSLERYNQQLVAAATTLPGPICAEYAFLAERPERCDYAWPTAGLQELMADRRGFKKSEHWLTVANDYVYSFRSPHGVVYQARLYQNDAGNLSFRKHQTTLTVTWSIRFWRLHTDPNMPVEAPVFCVDLRYILDLSERAASASPAEHAPQERALGERHISARDVFKSPIASHRTL
ncbi:hypothetical protein JCM10908_003580 [Rhodotorula pacifica]|uniref:uncharacterized protein n=1 Tax=Rhodotorula pacifica TaxID=1495444 RepID=UPI00317050FA